MKKQLLEKSLSEGSLIGIRTESHEYDESIIGFVKEVKDSVFVLNEIDEYGTLIGLTTISIESVLRIEVDDRYQRRLEFLHKSKPQFDSNKRVSAWDSEAELQDHLNLIVGKEIVTTFFLEEDEFVIGFLLAYDGSNFSIRNVGVEGDYDGESCYAKEDLLGIRYDGLEEQKIKLLFENRDKFGDS